MKRIPVMSICALLLFAPTVFADKLAVIVNPASGIRTLTRNQTIDIFLGRFLRLPSGGAAMPIDLHVGHPERQQFYLLLVQKNPAQMSSYWARLVFSGQASPPFQAPNAQTALELVAGNPNAIAYVAYADAAALDKRVRVVFELNY